MSLILGGQDGTLLMLAIADPSKEDTESLLTSLPSRTGQIQDRTQVGNGRLADYSIIQDRITVGEDTGVQYR
jgi:hypothetical protein